MADLLEWLAMILIDNQLVRRRNQRAEIIKI